jgi:hypothetical protein
MDKEIWYTVSNSYRTLSFVLCHKIHANPELAEFSFGEKL